MSKKSNKNKEEDLTGQAITPGTNAAAHQEGDAVRNAQNENEFDPAAPRTAEVLDRVDENNTEKVIDPDPKDEEFPKDPEGRTEPDPKDEDFPSDTEGKKVLTIDIAIPLDKQPQVVRDMITGLGFDSLEAYFKAQEEPALQSEELQYPEDTKAEGADCQQSGCNKEEPSLEQIQHHNEGVAFMKNFRQLLDMDSKLMFIHTPSGSAEVLRAKHWCGKIIFTKGEIYRVATEVKDIPKATDTIPEEAFIKEDNRLRLLNPLDVINHFRDSIGNMLKSFEAYGESYGPNTRAEAIAFTQVYIKLNEARFEMGEELNRMRKNGL